MKRPELQKTLEVGVEAARAAGKVLRENLNRPKRINQTTQHDIKLELDVRCQTLIERVLLRHNPTLAVLGEEGIVGDPTGPARWVVDPIDGTVNFTYGLPHACVSIALQVRSSDDRNRSTSAGFAAEGYTTVLGIVYDPFCDELWTAVNGRRARLNGRLIRVSEHTTLRESIVSVGFAKNRKSLNRMLPIFGELVHRVRKVRMMGSAALALTYVASGRLDAYVESGIRLWDIAAGGLILACAGGKFVPEPIAGNYAYRLVATNGHIHRAMGKFL